MASVLGASLHAQQPEPQVRFLEGNKTATSAVAFTADGKLILSAGHDGVVRAWDRTTGQLVSTVVASGGQGATGKPEPLLGLAIAPQGLSFATASRDGKVSLFDLGRSAPIVEWGGVPGQVTALEPSPDGRYLLTADAAGVVRWWDSQSKNAVRDMAGLAGPAVAASLDEPQGLIMSLAADGTLRASKLADGQLVGTTLVPPAVAAVWGTEHRQVIVAGQDGWLRRANWPPVPTKPLGSHGGQATSLALSPNGEWVASGGFDQQVLTYQLADGKPLQTLREGPGRITAVAIAADGAQVVAGGDQGQLKVWRMADGQAVANLLVPAGVIHALASHPKASEFATAGAEPMVRLWSWPEPRRQFGGPQQAALRTILSGDGKTLWTLHADRAARSWQTSDGKSLKTIGNLPENPTVFCLSSDERTLLVGDTKGEVSVFATTNGALVTSWGAHLGAVVALQREPGGKGILSAGADGAVKIWGEVPDAPAKLAAPFQPTAFLAGSPDGKTLVAAQPEGTILAVDIITNKVLQRWTSPLRANITAIVMSADGKQVWATDAAGYIRGWQIESGKLIAQFAGTPEGPTSVALSRKGEWLATTHADGEVRLWNIAIADQSLRDGDPNARVTQETPRLPVVSSADGQSAAAATAQGAVDWRSMADGKVLRAGIVSVARPRTLSLRPDGGELALGDEAGDAHLYASGDGAAESHWRAHEGPITASQYHPGGSQLATSGMDGMVRVWQLPVVAPQTLVSAGQVISAYNLTFDGARLYVATSERRVAGFDMATGERTFLTEPQALAPTAVMPSFDNSFVAVADAGGGISIRSSADGQLAFRMHAHASAARGIAFPRGAAPWVTVGDDGALRVWEYPTPPRVFTGHEGKVEVVTVAPNGLTVASVAADKSVRLWNLGDGSPSWTLAHDMPVRALAWKQDSQQLATVDAAQRVRIWNLADGQQLAVVEPTAVPLASVGWMPDGTLTLAHADGAVRFWNLAEKKETSQLATGAPLLSFVVLDATQQLLSAHADGTLKTWQLSDRKPLATINAGGPFDQLAVTRDGKKAVVASRDKSLRVFQLDNGAAGPRVGDLPAAVRGLSWSVDGNRVAASLADGSVRVWMATGEATDQFDLGGPQPTGVAFAGDGKSVVVGGEDGGVRVVRLLALRKIAASGQPLTSVVLAPDNATAIVGGRDRNVTLWNITTGAAVRTLGGSGDVVTSVELSPDGSKVYATSLDKQVRAWNFGDGQALATLPQPAAALGVSASRDGQRLAVTLVGGLVRVHDVATGRVLQVFAQRGKEGAALPPDTVVTPLQFGRDNLSLLWPQPSGDMLRQPLGVIAAFPAHAGGVTQMAWSPNGQHFITTGVDKQAKVHDLQGKVVVPLAGGEMELVSLALRRDGAQAAAVTRDHHLITWNVGNGQQERKLSLPQLTPNPPPSPAPQVVYSLDQTRLIVAGGGMYRTLSLATGKWGESGLLGEPTLGTAVAPLAPAATRPQACDLTTLDARGQWRRMTLRLERSLVGHAGASTQCVFTTDDASLVTTGADKTVRQWTVANGAAVRQFGGATDVVQSLLVSLDGKRLAATCADKTVRLWNIADGAAVVTATMPAAMRQGAAAHDGKRFFVTGDDQIVRLFDFESGREVRRWAPAGPVTGITALGESAGVAMGQDAKMRSLVDATTRLWAGDSVKVHVASWLPYGKQLITCGEDKIVKVWNRDGTLAKSLSGYPFAPTSISVRHDGLQVAVAGQVGGAHPIVYRWNLADGQLLPSFSTPAAVVAVQWLGPNRLAVAGGDQRVRLYQCDPPLMLEEFPLAAAPSELTATSNGEWWYGALANGQAFGAKPACLRGLVGHQGAVTGVTYVADGRWLVTASADQTIRVWDHATGAVVATCAGNASPVLALGATADGRRVAASCADNQIRVWSLAALLEAAGKAGATPPAKDAPIPAVPLLGNWPVTAPARSVRWNADGTRLVSTHDDSWVRLWQVAADGPMPPPHTEVGRELQRWSGHMGPVTASLIADGGSQVISTSNDMRILRHTVQVTSAQKAHEGALAEMRVSSDGNRAVTAGADKQVVIWDLRNAKSLAVATPAKTIAIDGAGKIVLTADDAQLRVWNGDDGKPLAAFPQPAAITSLSLSRDGRRVFVATADNAIRQGRLTIADGKATWESQAEYKGPAAAAARLALTPDERWLVSAHADQGVRYWLAPSGTPRFVWDESKRPVYGVTFSANGELLAAAGGDRTVRLYSTTDGKLSASSAAGTGHQDAIQSLAFAASGKELATAGADGAVQLWDVAAKPLERLTVGVTGRLRSVAYSNDGGQLFVGGTSRAWQAFQRGSLQRTRHVDAHNDTLVKLVVSPSGNRLATLDYQGHVALWDVGSGNLLFHQQLPARPTLDMAYAPDGVELAVAAADGRVVRVTIPPPVR